MSTNDNNQMPTGENVSPDLQPIQDLDTAERTDCVIEEGVVHLIACRSKSTGSLAFPRRDVCQVSGARDMEPLHVGPKAMLYTFSTIHISATRATPYTLGYVDFANGLRVLAEVRGADIGALSCDTPVVLAADDESWWVEPDTSSGPVAGSRLADAERAQ